MLAEAQRDALIGRPWTPETLEARLTRPEAAPREIVEYVDAPGAGLGKLGEGENTGAKARPLKPGKQTFPALEVEPISPAAAAPAPDELGLALGRLGPKPTPQALLQVRGLMRRLAGAQRRAGQAARGAVKDFALREERATGTATRPGLVAAFMRPGETASLFKELSPRRAAEAERIMRSLPGEGDAASRHITTSVARILDKLGDAPTASAEWQSLIEKASDLGPAGIREQASSPKIAEAALDFVALRNKYQPLLKETGVISGEVKDWAPHKLRENIGQGIDEMRRAGHLSDAGAAALKSRYLQGVEEKGFSPRASAMKRKIPGSLEEIAASGAGPDFFASPFNVASTLPPLVRKAVARRSALRLGELAEQIPKGKGDVLLSQLVGAVPGLEGKTIPRELARDLERITNLVKKDPGAISKTWAAWRRWSQSNMLSSLGRISRDFSGEASAAYASLGPKFMQPNVMTKIANLQDVAIPGGRRLSVAQTDDALARHGVMTGITEGEYAGGGAAGRAQGRGYIESMRITDPSVNTVLSKLESAFDKLDEISAFNPVSKNFLLNRFMNRMAKDSDEFWRRYHATRLVQGGKNLDDAAEEVFKFHVYYGPGSPAGEFLRKYVPFYSFFSQAPGIGTRMLARRPSVLGVATAKERLGEMQFGDLPEAQRRATEESESDYFRAAGYTRTGVPSDVVERMGGKPGDPAARAMFQRADSIPESGAQVVADMLSILGAIVTGGEQKLEGRDPRRILARLDPALQAAGNVLLPAGFDPYRVRPLIEKRDIVDVTGEVLRDVPINRPIPGTWLATPGARSLAEAIGDKDVFQRLSANPKTMFYVEKLLPQMAALAGYMPDHLHTKLAKDPAYAQAESAGDAGAMLRAIIDREDAPDVLTELALPIIFRWVGAKFKLGAPEAKSKERVRKAFERKSAIVEAAVNRPGAAARYME